MARSRLRRPRSRAGQVHGHLVLLLLALASSAPPVAAQSADDVAFVRGMMAHHAQAIELAALIAGRSTNAPLASLGQRIAVSQADEIAMLRQWLRSHAPRAADASVGPDPHAQHAAPGAPDSAPAARMPGMLAAADIAALASLRGAPFERGFLEAMIRHHEGALVMVAALLRRPGAARQPQLYDFAAGVDSDQRAEIARMQRLLTTLTPREPPSSSRR